MALQRQTSPRMASKLEAAPPHLSDGLQSPYNSVPGFRLFASLGRFDYTSQPMRGWYETTIRVRYAETDQMGVVYYANFFVWFEIGRVELLRQMGLQYKEMETQDDSYIVVAEAHCRYLKPARYDDVLRIRTRVAESRSRTIRFAYEVLNDATAELLATGETTHVVCDRSGRPRTLPAKYRQIFMARRPAPATQA